MTADNVVDVELCRDNICHNFDHNFVEKKSAPIIHIIISVSARKQDSINYEISHLKTTTTNNEYIRSTTEVYLALETSVLREFFVIKHDETFR